MTPEEWFDQLRAAVGPATPEVTVEERKALLDLARIAAHASERWTAPISTFQLGVALASTPPADRADAISRLVEQLERRSAR